MQSAKTIRDSFKSKIGLFIDYNYLYKKEFSFIKKDTYSKVIYRLIQNGELMKIQNSLVYVGKFDFSCIDEVTIKKSFLEQGAGSYSGLSLAYCEHIIKDAPETITLFTNKVTNNEYVFANIIIKGIKEKISMNQIKLFKILSLLETNLSCYEEINSGGLQTMFKGYCMNYLDSDFRKLDKIFKFKRIVYINFCRIYKSLNYQISENDFLKDFED